MAEPRRIARLLIANRGEIAVRIARTAADMGIETLAVHSPDDAHCLHVRHADRAVALSGTGVAAYLDVEQVVATAVATGCDAIHPGYGLLSENIAFVEACDRAGVTFVGPTAQSMAIQGDKVAARRFAREAGIPVVEGIDRVASADEALAFFRSQGGVPVMLKAVNGGGGRGMRILREETEIAGAFAQCEAEARTSFGDPSLYAELFLPAVRHIEVQIVGDGERTVHLWERDCSIQRRNQKIIELAPAPKLDPQVRANLLAAAVKIGQASGYRGLGTVEFLVDVTARQGTGYYFIETNPRIQVEHTITEEITGLDLVEIQLRIASGETIGDLRLEEAQARAPTRSALQLRINTETFVDGEVVPTGGILQAFQPPGGPGVRVDSHGYRGYRTNPNFDSLLAKLIVSSGSGSLETLLDKARRSLAEFQITGVESNAPFLSALLDLPQLRQWDLTVRGVGEAIAQLALDTNPARPRYFENVASAEDARRPQDNFPEGSLPVVAPFQAALAALSVCEGDTVAQGDELLVVEAMKMQQVIRAPVGGRVLRVLVAVGDVIAANQPILLLADTEAGSGSAVGPDQFDLDHIRADLATLNDRIASTLDQSRPNAVERRRSRGQRTARENLNDLCDPDSFVEYGQLAVAGQRSRRSIEELVRATPADGVVTGLATVNASLHPDAARVAVAAYDGSVMAGTQGYIGHKKLDRLIELAHERDLPFIAFTEGGGGRPGEVDFDHVLASALGTETFRLLASMRGSYPTIGIQSGFCFAGNAALFGACNFKIATRASWIGLGGPAMIEAGGLGSFGPKDVGPASIQAANGLIDVLVDDEAEATAAARQLLSYFQGKTQRGADLDQRPLRHLIPENRKRVYDMRAVIAVIADEGSFLELKPLHAPGMLTGLLRVAGRPMGLIANNPMHLGGAIDAQASAKAASFLRLCSMLKLPLLSLCDTPGFMVGPRSEEQGAVAAASEFLAAGSSLETPIVFLCLRKGYGLGAQAMAGGSFTAPVATLSWPTGEFGPMGLEGSVELGFKRELDAEPTAAARDALFLRLVDEAYKRGGAINVASLLEVDAVIDPIETKLWIDRSLAL